ncbi:MAG TPA: heparan-alpha-glucosaminide N-acetyltransferase domain-containing protein [Longimicrobium sp.]|nr:heparan-alpha-glucosaminide N-acetyltransferase domain-containing protein [Longimicrobium sp.]
MEQRTSSVAAESLPPGTVPAVVRDAPVVAAPSRGRIDSVDLLRGLVMVFMLLDHTRDFVHAGAVRFDPTDLSQTSPELFLTRWITHFCAPVFVFLAGTSVYLQLLRGKTKAEVSRLLWTRGLWLIVLEFTLVRAGVVFNLDYGAIVALPQVIWVIGVSMIVLAALVHLPLRAVAAFGIGMIALHNLLDPIRVPFWRGPGTPPPDWGDALWMLLHQSGPLPLQSDGSPLVIVLYPLVPWIGVLAAGYAFGSLYALEGERRRRLLVRLGLGMLAAFLVIRGFNLYGNPGDWSPQRNAVYSVLSFLNTNKYPPSLLFLLMTLGPAMLALAWFERARSNAASRALVTLGRVPMFYYLLQWPVAHLVGIGLSLAFAKPVVTFALGGPVPPDYGFGLGMVYVAWIIGLIVLYPLCAWYAGVKRRRKDWWLSYM